MRTQPSCTCNAATYTVTVAVRIVSESEEVRIGMVVRKGGLTVTTLHGVYFPCGKWVSAHLNHT